MRFRLSREEAEYLKDQLDIWIEGFTDIDDEMPKSVLLELLHHREMAERIRTKLWTKLRS